MKLTNVLAKNLEIDFVFDKGIILIICVLMSSFKP